MTTQAHTLSEPMAFYAAAQSIAEWLICGRPHAIYRWDAPSSGRTKTLTQESMRLVKVSTKFLPVAPLIFPTNAELRAARSSTINTAFVSLAGIAGTRLLPRLRKEAFGQLTELWTNDLKRTSRIFRPLAQSDGMSTYLACQVLELASGLFENPRLAVMVQHIARCVISFGSFTDRDDGFDETLLDVDDLGVESHVPIFKWPNTDSKFIHFKPRQSAVETAAKHEATG